MCEGRVYVFLHGKSLCVQSDEEKVLKCEPLRTGRGWRPGQLRPVQPLVWVLGKLGEASGEAMGLQTSQDTIAHHRLEVGEFNLPQEILRV